MEPDKAGEGTESSESAESKATSDTPPDPKGKASPSARTGGLEESDDWDPLSDRAPAGGHDTAERIAHAKETAEHLIADYPWWTLGLGLAIGVVFGLVIARD